jgi:alpha-ketoglutarate-dependent taurine dioxygenase
MKNEITDTHFALWNECFASFRLLSNEVQQLLRRCAVNHLVEKGAEEVGSSDTSHELFYLWKINQRSWESVVMDEFRNFCDREACR